MRERKRVWNKSCADNQGSCGADFLQNDSPLAERQYLRDLRVEVLPLSALKPYERNARKHSPKQIRQIAKSICNFGFANPILIDGKGEIIAGHGRFEGAKCLGMQSVPTICLNGMTPAQKRAYALADNRIAENSGWDQELVALELAYITELDISFDLTLTGFETPEIDFALHSYDDDDDHADSHDDAHNEYADRANLDANTDEEVAAAAAVPVSRVGDLWRLPPDHRLFCGDATDADSFARLMSGERAQMVFADPPYNVPINGHVSGSGSITHREFAMASGEMSEKEFTEFLGNVIENLIRHSIDGSLHYLCMDWRHTYELLSAGRGIYAELKNICVWKKDNGGMGSFYRSQHEFILVFKNGIAPHVNNVELGRHGRNRTNVWEYPGANSFRPGRLEELASHPTVKPVALVADAILDCTKRGGLVLDCFGGSGTTLLAAERSGRRAYVMELDPVYVDLSVRRFQKVTGQQAINAETGRTFADTERERLGETASKSKQSGGEEESRG
jgi:DNA modification methylase